MTSYRKWTAEVSPTRFGWYISYHNGTGWCELGQFAFTKERAEKKARKFIEKKNRQQEREDTETFTVE